MKYTSSGDEFGKNNSDQFLSRLANNAIWSASIQLEKMVADGSDTELIRSLKAKLESEFERICKDRVRLQRFRIVTSQMITDQVAERYSKAIELANEYLIGR